MIQSLTRETGQRVNQQAPVNWRWLGRAVKLVDGTTVTLSDTPENQIKYPQQSNQNPGLGFPIARAVGLLCAATGVVLDAAIGPYSGKDVATSRNMTGSGHALFRELLGSIAAGDLILADRHYCAYFIIAQLQARGIMWWHGRNPRYARAGSPVSSTMLFPIRFLSARSRSNPKCW